MFLAYFEAFLIKQNAKTSRFGEHFEVTEIIQKVLEYVWSLISNFGIIKTPKIQYIIIIKNTRKTNNQVKLLPYSGPY